MLFQPTHNVKMDSVTMAGQLSYHRKKELMALLTHIRSYALVAALTVMLLLGMMSAAHTV